MTKRQANTNRSITFKAISFGFALLILFYDSILILLSGLRKGIFKKEVLSKKSKLGFDFKIIIK